MYKLIDNIYIEIHKNIQYTETRIKNNPDLFITSSDYHEYSNFLKNEYGPINIYNIVLFTNFITEIKNKVRLPIVYYVYSNKNNTDLLNALFLFGCYFIIKETILSLSYYLIYHIFLNIVHNIIFVVRQNIMVMLLL